MPQPLVLPIAQYMPDQPSQPSIGSATVLNVVPRTENSYGPIPTPAPVYNALGSRCQGGAGFRDNLGDTYLFAGDSTNLYLIKAGLDAWQNASKSAGAYSTGETGWYFTKFNDDVLATNGNDLPQVLTLPSGSTFTDLAGNPPRGRYIAVVKNSFVVLGNTYDNTNGNKRQRVWWSAVGNPRDWPELGSDDAAQKQSGAVDLLGPGGQVQGFAPDLINADAVVFQEFAVRRMAYSGPPSTFSFLPVENARGCLAPGSIIVSGGVAYYWGQDGIYAFDGGSSRPIGAGKVDKTVYADIDLGNLSRVVGAADARNKIAWWAYPSLQSSGGNPDKLLAYNWELDRWSLAEVTCETLLRMLTIGYTLDQLETVLGYATVDEIPYPLSSEVWQGGRVALAMFDTDHKLNFFSGNSLSATVDTAEMQPVPGRRLFIRNSRPRVDGVDSTARVAIGYRERLQDDVTWSSAVTINELGYCPVRRSGRLIRARIRVSTGVNWTNISGVELDAVPQGSR